MQQGLSMKYGNSHVDKQRHSSIYDNDLLLPNGTQVVVERPGATHSSHKEGVKYPQWKYSLVFAQGEECTVSDSFYCQSNARRLYIIESNHSKCKTIISAYGLYVCQIKKDLLSDDLFAL